MSEHSDDGFDRWLKEEMLSMHLKRVCQRKGKDVCRLYRNDDAMLECRTCKQMVDE